MLRDGARLAEPVHCVTDSAPVRYSGCIGHPLGRSAIGKASIASLAREGHEPAVLVTATRWHKVG